jgi:hypothetical protein
MGKKIVVDLEVKSNKGVKEVEKLNKELKTTNKELGGATDTLDKFTGGAVTKIRGFKGAIKGLTNGFKSLRVAIIATGIGALLVGILAVKTAFTSSEEGQNKFAKLLGVIGSVTGNLVDLLADLGEGIINAFTNPKQALINLKNAIKENITNRIESLIDTFGFLGKAIKKVFSGDFKGALEDAKSAGSSYVDSLTGVKNSIDKVTESTKSFIKELKEEAKIAGQIADQRAKADKLERGLIIERAKANRDRAELLDKAANKEKFTAQERINFLEEAGKIEEEITRKEIESARLRFEAKVAENALSKSTKQDLDDEARLKAELINLETARLTKQKLVTSQIVAAKREEVARLKAIEDEEKARKKEQEEIKSEEDKTKKLAEDEAEKQRLIDAEERANREIEIEQSIADRKKQINLNYINFAASLSGLLQQIAGKNKALAMAGLILEKGAAIANVVVKAKESIATATANEAKVPFFTSIGAFTIPNPLKASSLATTAKSIAMTKIGAGLAIAGIGATAIGQGKGISGGGGQVSTPSPSVPTGASTPPSFNVVGASSTDQLASAIGGQSQQPVQAYVVANDVTTAQSMDRNIIDDASLGD